MKTIVRIGLVGDRSEDVRAHRAIPLALQAAGRAVGIDVVESWHGTNAIAESTAADVLGGLDGIWCVPGSPYASMEGALAAIRFARESRKPFLGTCAGFQHAVIEIARSLAAVALAEHQESSPDAADPVIHRLACPLREDERPIRLTPGSRLARIYGRDMIREGYHCSFGVNPRYRAALERAGLAFTATDEDGGVRALELTEHPFFLGALFQFELAALRGHTPPPAVEFVRAAATTR